MRLLFSKPDSFGDQFIAAGPVQALRRSRPEIQIVWHVRAGMEFFAPAVGAEVFLPDPSRTPEAEAARLGAIRAPLVVLPYPLSPYEPWTNEIRARVSWWAAFLRATKWDASILGLVNRNWVGDLTVAVAPSVQRIGFAASAARQPLMNEAGAAAGPDGPAFTTILAPSFTRPESAQLRDLFAVLEPRIAPAPLWQPSQPWQPRPKSESHRILIAPGVGGDSRRAWGARNLSAVASALTPPAASVGWIEGPGDAAYLEGIPADQRIAVGSDIGGLLAALRDADLLICHDTAYVHIAAGFGIPTVAIFGAGQDGRFHPTGGRVKIVHSQIACAGCQWHCLWERLVCVADIPIAAVAAAAQQMLANEGQPLPVPLATPVARESDVELAAVKRRLQAEVLALNADRFARLQIIQSLLAFQQSPPAPRS
jgi:ADP-heptose:LPS heptosyltransferase